MEAERPPPWQVRTTREVMSGPACEWAEPASPSLIAWTCRDCVEMPFSQSSGLERRILWFRLAHGKAYGRLSFLAIFQ